MESKGEVEMIAFRRAPPCARTSSKRALLLRRRRVLLRPFLTLAIIVIMSPSVTRSNSRVMPASQQRLRVEHSETPPLAEPHDLDEIKAMAREARLQLSSLAGVVTGLDRKINELEMRQKLHIARKRRREDPLVSGQSAAATRPGERIEAWLATTEQAPQDEDAATRPLAGTPAAASEASSSVHIDEKEQEYLDTFFPDLTDMPCRLLLGIMEHVYRKALKKSMAPEALSVTSNYCTILKAAINAVVEKIPYRIPGRTTWGFRLVAQILEIHSHDDVRPLSPAMLDMMLWSQEEHGEDDSMRRAVAVTMNILVHLLDVLEILPPVFRAILEGLSETGDLDLYDEDYYGIHMGVFCRRAAQLNREQKAEDVCNLLAANETGLYVAARLEGASTEVALEKATGIKRGRGGRQTKRARRTR